jgi:phosphoribosyl 1,2-cyclic phosphodiesterase
MKQEVSFKKKNILSVSILASGSKGNAIRISDGQTSILLDAGLSGIEIERRLKNADHGIDNIDAILVSHEHSDHVKGVGILARRFKLPVYISAETQKASVHLLGSLPETVHFQCGHAFNINTLAVRPFSLSHDAADPAGFTISKDNIKIGIATDLGIATTMVKSHLKGCNALIIEANHDPDMLIKGPYPWPLKQRVKGRTGHLSNSESGLLIKELLHEKLTCVILAHLSETNNTPEKALNEVGQALQQARTKLFVATQNPCETTFRIA